MIFNQTEKEERAYLMDIIALLAANIEQMDKAIEDKSKDVMEHKLYLWEICPNWTAPRKVRSGR